MGYREPRLNIYRETIDAEQWRGLLIDELIKVPTFSPQTIDQVTMPAANPMATIISHTELSKLHNSIGVEPDERHLTVLTAHIAKALPTAFEEIINIDTLPAVVHKDTVDSRRRMLTVGAHSTVVAERDYALGAIRTFYDLRRFPKNTLLSSALATGITIARGDKREKARMVEYLGAAISGGNVLPPMVSLSPIDFDIFR